MRYSMGPHKSNDRDAVRPMWCGLLTMPAHVRVVCRTIQDRTEQSRLSLPIMPVL